MRKIFVLACLSVAVATTTFGQSTATNTEQEAAYTKTINQRAEKIVATLDIKDAAKASKVQSIIADQYRNLNNIHADRDSQVKAVKAKGEFKEVTDVAVKKIEDD